MEKRESCKGCPALKSLCAGSTFQLEAKHGKSHLEIVVWVAVTDATAAKCNNTKLAKIMTEEVDSSRLNGTKEATLERINSFKKHQRRNFGTTS